MFIFLPNTYHMKILYALPIAVVALIAISFSYKPMPYSKKKLTQPAWPQETICPGSPVPDGWVITDYQPLSECCNRVSAAKRVISEIDSAKLGDTLSICPQAIPAGWVVTAYVPYPNGCCSTKGHPSQMILIKRISKGSK
jgi:hypothetical protein